MIVDDETAENMIEKQLDKYAQDGIQVVTVLDIVFDLGLPLSQSERILIKLLGPPNEEKD